MKAYKKPEIAFEDFSLSTNIAAGCDISAGWNSTTCAYTIHSGPMTFNLFTPANASCTTTSGDILNSVCYNVPSDNNTVYAS